MSRNARMSDDVEGELDGRRVRLGDVPKDRVSDWSAMVDGRRVRPFRFASRDEDDGLVVVKK